jgi:hypothetical protein
MIQPSTKINDGAYMVLSMLYTLGFDLYDGRVTNQTILGGGSPPLDELLDEEDQLGAASA